jgi:hypothetical protein
MSKYAQAVINWERPERPDGGRWCKTSSMLWARLLLAPSRVVFADGTFAEFPGAQLDKVEIDMLDIPDGPDLHKTGNLQKCVVFTVKSPLPNLRIRVRAYHKHDGTEFGHPGRMRHECTDTNEWDRAYKKLMDALNAMIKTTKEPANG